MQIMSKVINVQYYKIRNLVPYENNAREHSEEQISQIMESMKEFGFLNPIIVGKDNLVLAGHGRLMAAGRLKLKEVPGIPVGHLSDRQQRAYILADNKIGDNSRWDFDLLSKEMDKLVQEGFDLNITGFDEGEIDAILKESEDFLPETVKVSEGSVSPSELGRSEEEKKPVYNTSKAVSKKDQVWQLDKHQIICGKCTKAGNGFIDATIVRWQNATGKDAVLVSSGQTFNEAMNEANPE